MTLISLGLALNPRLILCFVFIFIFLFSFLFLRFVFMFFRLYFSVFSAVPRSLLISGHMLYQNRLNTMDLQYFQAFP